ncbi:MAG: arsenite methyltransferase [Candidatus Limnocylindrales bacterium]
MTQPTDQPVDLREQVRDRYAKAALLVQAPRPTRQASCCADDCCGGPTAAVIDPAEADRFGAALYDASDLAALPDAAILASLGCGNPTAVAELRVGETVLDLGSGGGIDVLLSAKRVGPTGMAYGLDMTDEMLALADANRATAGVTNARFLKGEMEHVPLPAATVDVIISNCVINLSTDKPGVFAEMARVLRPGGRIGISDVVADDVLTPAQRAERGSYVGCIAGALSFAEYRAALAAAGFEGVSVTTSHSVADGMYSAIIKAVRPARGLPAPERR